MNDQTQNRLLTGLATMGPIGYLPKMPGTWGSLAAALLGYFILLPLPAVVRPAVIMVVLAVGVEACTRAEIVLGKKDPGCVVFDELFGQWVAMLPLAAGTPWWMVAVSFVLFRIFDIFKPWPVGKIERSYEGGLGVMLDDGAAGVYAFLGVWLLAALL
ncbi:MAG: phosphatidylglycerophosphatase A [Proteobacteria bacterium]|nr:phosphatidylglycerophosphatase A [Pseudomonadota bacterium]